MARFNIFQFITGIAGLIAFTLLTAIVLWLSWTVLGLGEWLGRL